MSIVNYQDDVNRILALRESNGADFWATKDGSISKCGPFSTIEVCSILSELGYSRTSEELVGTANLIFGKFRKDGRIPTGVSGSVYPCQTGAAARALCQLGYAADIRLQSTYQHFLSSQHIDGGWRCNTSKYGKGPETESSNPGPTLAILDVFRYTSYLNTDQRLDRAVSFLLDHWDSRKPIGPCHYGIGTLFMKVEYPMFRYNILNYVYTLSFYDSARKDQRFRSALGILQDKLVDGQLIVENPNNKFRDFEFCRKGEKSELATNRYQGILENVKGRNASRNLRGSDLRI